MMHNLMIDWSQLLPHLLTLWLIGWGLRALLIGFILGGLLWLFRRTR
ncbi:hypothetical protein [Levilactobacillus fujinensis]|uniref:Uncharacterized protein n=1 Tax=Levilactobacillus fujinensis TaxID=2486024 RepID=A0ABW1TJ29_9LACO|nr:hypothetical protein [Levilactobacillus fujinensis]